MAVVSALSKLVFWFRNTTFHPRYEKPCERPNIKLVDASVVFPLLSEGVPVDISSYGCQGPDFLDLPVATYRRLLNIESSLFHERFMSELGCPKTNFHDAMLVLANAFHNPLIFLLQARDQELKEHQKQDEHKEEKDQEDQTAQESQVSDASEKYILDLSILGVDTKPECESLATITHLRRIKNTSLLRVTSIFWDGHKIKPSDSLFLKAVSLVLAGAATFLTMRDHLYYTHLLATGSIWCLAARNLPPTHYIYKLLHPHTYAVNRVNVRKGIGLMDVFKEDFSFTPQGLKELFEICFKEFKFSYFMPDEIEKRVGRKAAELSSVLQAARRMWKATQKYVNVWFANGTSSIPDSDIYAKRFIADVKSLPYNIDISADNPTDFIRQLLTLVIYISVFYHEAVGDAIEPLAKVMLPWIAKVPTKETRRKQLVSKAVVLVVFWAATTYEYQLSKDDWISSLDRWMQKPARQFQEESCTVHKFFEVGVNK